MSASQNQDIPNHQAGKVERRGTGGNQQKKTHHGLTGQEKATRLNQTKASNTMAETIHFLGKENVPPCLLHDPRHHHHILPHPLPLPPPPHPPNHPHPHHGSTRSTPFQPRQETSTPKAFNTL